MMREQADMYLTESKQKPGLPTESTSKHKVPQLTLGWRQLARQPS
ncbi:MULTISPECIES: hypothetical protein [unclassified Mesorhizobium]